MLLWGAMDDDVDRGLSRKSCEAGKPGRPPIAVAQLGSLRQLRGHRNEYLSLR